MAGEIKANDNLLLGPDGNGHFMEVQARENREQLPNLEEISTKLICFLG